MKTSMIQYKVKADRAEENANLIKNVFKELSEKSPEGVKYSSYKLEDGVSFMHIVTLEGDDNPIPGLLAFVEFQKNIAERCELPPKSSVIELVGSYQI